MNHELFMERCLQLAANAKGRTYPNPMVGAVIVYNGKIIGEGYHKRAGEPHAEVIAINSVRDKSLLPKSTLYVNLEPCSHYGRTPPCADLIVKWKIPRVVVGTIDTTAKVAGKGIARLKAAGTEVILGVLEKKARWLNRRFFTFHEKRRPYIILKWAQSADGFIDVKRSPHAPRQSYAITSQFAHTLVHKWRSEEQAILVGTNTVINDDPQLTVRLWYGQNPVRLCMDFKGRIPKESKIFDSQAPTFCLKDKKYYKIENLINFMYEKQLQSILVEGGAKVINAFFEKNFWDEIRFFVRKDLILHGLKKPNFDGQLILTHDLRKETLFVLIQKNETHCCNIPNIELHAL